MSIKTPFLTTDSIIECFNNDGEFQGIVLIERKNPPLGVALPGGFVDIGETVENACIREMKEETELDIELSIYLESIQIQSVIKDFIQYRLFMSVKL